MTGTRLLCRALLVAATGGVLAAGPALATPPPAPVAAHPTGHTGTASVVVTAEPSRLGAVERAVRAAGGTVTRPLPLISGFAGRLPAAAVPGLRHLAGVRGLSVDQKVGYTSVDPALGYDATADPQWGSLYQISQIVGAQSAYQSGYSGKGVDVALIDTGISRVQGLDTGNVVDGPDLSFDSQVPSLTHLDGFGHGTHMASIIAGRDVVQSRATAYAGDTTHFLGIAPDTRLINVKVGAADGATDVTQVIAALDWVVQHAHDQGFNIRVVSLSFGTESGQSYLLDPLAYAAEQAYKHGLVVVAAAGNDGLATPSLADPAIDPFVIAVGAVDPNGTQPTRDDTVAPFANHGTSSRPVDLVAPGVHVLGLRDPGGVVDVNNPGAVVGTRFIRGSGTSQSTAVVAGVAAVLLQKFPTATPDQVKNLLTLTANNQLGAGTSTTYAGAGEPNLAAALSRKLGSATQGNTAKASGTGSLDAARGGSLVSVDGVDLTGNQDIFGHPFDPAAMAKAEAAATAWTGGTWNGNVWTGDSWSGLGWLGHSWSGQSWSGHSWSDTAWVSGTWSGQSWSGHSWSGSGWSGHSWSGHSWSDASWSGHSWS